MLALTDFVTCCHCYHQAKVGGQHSEMHACILDFIAFTQRIHPNLQFSRHADTICASFDDCNRHSSIGREHAAVNVPRVCGVQVRENLELSFVQEAEMVFTTLSSTGRKIFSRLENAFENVLVDEAAQASEIAILQPLTLGCTR